MRAPAPFAAVTVVTIALAPAAVGQSSERLRAGVADARHAGVAMVLEEDLGRSAGMVARLSAAERGSSVRIAAQIVGGALAAGLLGYAAWSALDDPESPDRRVKGDAGYTPNANTAYAVGSFVGSVAAVYVIGRGDGSRGSLGATALGAAVATIPLALGRHEPYLPLIGLILGAPAQAIGATIGYQVTRREP